MNTTELRSSLALALVFFLRMLGLFLILPVFVLYAETLRNATPILIGIGLGCYGLTQAIFQIPFGMLSDRIGRKTVITAGLLIFTAGSVIAGLAESIYGVIIGRALQGCGAIAAAIMALASDLTRDLQRSKAMAFIGIGVGLAFSLAFIAGPVLDPLIGVPGLFFLAAFLALIALVPLFTLVPSPGAGSNTLAIYKMTGQLQTVIKNRQLLQFDAGIFILHMVLMSNFIVIPLLLRDGVNLTSGYHWHIYLPTLVISAIIMFPLMFYAEKHGRIQQFYAGAILILGLSQAGFYFLPLTLYSIFFLLAIFFIAFNYLEAMLPSLISRSAPADRKGTALGIYSTSQFIGTFTGGLTGGILHEHFGTSAIFLFGCFMCMIWLCFAGYINLSSNQSGV